VRCGPRVAPLLGVAALLACGKPGQQPDEAPHATVNGAALIQYPPRLFDEGREGDVMLRLFVDSTGQLRPESSRVAQSSGSSTLDSAALAGAARLHYAPARRDGRPVPTAFLQPIEFRRPPGAAPTGSSDAAPR